MPLTEPQITSIHQAFKNDPAAQDALLRAQPNGAGLKFLVDGLKASNLVTDQAIKQLSVFYSFDPSRNFPSRSGVTVAGHPVRGSLVSDDDQDVGVLNADPAIIDALCFPEVFSSRLESVRQQWMACARGTDPNLPEADIKAAASSIGLRLSLGTFVGGPGDKDCPGSKCPVTVTGR
ncbi:MAG: hypothetical protein NTW01_05440 [Gammaproteobacteria bacterium]|jgi:hypothetical protein|nr:hypothetical protein [Gammaproteobacteria bacterium]